MAEKLTRENEELRKENAALRKEIEDLKQQLMGGGQDSSWNAFKRMVPGARKKIIEKNKVKESKKDIADMMEAAKSGDVDKVEKLLESGVPVDIEEPEYQETALMVAAKVGKKRVVELVLANRANIDKRDINGETALYKAAEWGRYDTVVALVQRGARLDVSTKRNKLTPLMIAAKNGHTDVAEVLVKEGASLKVLNSVGQNAIECARSNGRDDTADAIQKASEKRRKSKKIDPTLL